MMKENSAVKVLKEIYHANSNQNSGWQNISD